MTSRMISLFVTPFFALTVAGVIGGCSEELPTTPPQPEVILSPSNLVRLDDFDLELTFQSVLDDIRCIPGDGSCDWPGAATIDLQAVVGEDTADLNLSIGGEFPLDGSRFLWPFDTLGLTLTLVRLYPPRSNAPTAQADYRATIRVERASASSQEVSNVIITDLEPTAIFVDGFNIDSARIVGSRLYLSVSYGGGCRRHLFSMFMSPNTFIESEPRQANLYLRHYGAGDACRKIVYKEVVFNLGPISQKYRFTYGVEEQFRLNLFSPADSANSDQVLSLIFTPPTDALP